MTNILIQIGLAILSLLPIALSQAKAPKIRRYDCIAGLIAQPFWFSYGWYIEAWSLCFLGVIYTGVFAYGFYVKWIKVDKAIANTDSDSSPPKTA